MQPLTVILGIVLGSAFAIAFGLGTVLLVFTLRAGEHSRFAAEIPELARATVLFTGLAAAAALAFWGSLRHAVWRRGALLLLLGVLTGVVLYYWPE